MKDTEQNRRRLFTMFDTKNAWYQHDNMLVVETKIMIDTLKVSCKNRTEKAAVYNKFNAILQKKIEKEGYGSFFEEQRDRITEIFRTQIMDVLQFPQTLMQLYDMLFEEALSFSKKHKNIVRDQDIEALLAQESEIEEKWKKYGETLTAGKGKEIKSIMEETRKEIKKLLAECKDDFERLV